MKRREVIKGLTLLPFAGGVVESSLAGTVGAPLGRKIDWFSKSAVIPGPLKIGEQIYQSIGVEPVINCRGTFTIIGASVCRPEAREAMEYGHKYNAQLDELAFAVGQRLSELTGAEWGFVGSGCAGSLKAVAAGCVTGGCPDRLVRIPEDTMNMEKNEIITIGGGSTYDHGIRTLGVKMIRGVSVATLAQNINSRTAMIYMGSNGVAEVAAIAKPLGVPVVVDAAASALTWKPNLILQAGADVVCYSGGKCICGPQSAGLVLGRKDLLMSAWQASAPHHGPCRDNKVGREEQIGMLAAVESWCSRDLLADMKMYVSWAQAIADRSKGIDGVHTAVRLPGGLGNPSPSVTISWDPAKLNITARGVLNDLALNKPRIALSGNDAVAGSASGGGGGQSSAPATTNPWAAQLPVPPIAPMPPSYTASINATVYQMGAENVKTAADRIYEILSRKRTAMVGAPTMQAPAANIMGRWDVLVEYFSSKSPQMFVVENQDGNFLAGTHQGESTTREMTGTIDGNKVIFESRYRVPGQPSGVSYTFYGTVSGDTMSGDIDMGEYVTAKFTAKKYTYPRSRQPINVPVTRPLSS